MSALCRRYIYKKTRMTSLPTVQELRNVIPTHCFERSFWSSLWYTMVSATLTASLACVATLVLPVPSLDPGIFVIWTAFAAVQGTVLFGLWIIAHECGHGAFCDTAWVNDVIGFTLHSLLLVPYAMWQH